MRDPADNSSLRPSVSHPSATVAAGNPADDLPESPHALQLRRGFRNLRFDTPLEREFRTLFVAGSLPQIRRNLWIALAIVVGFSVLTHTVLEPSVNRLMDLIRLAMFGPILIFGLAVVRSRHYQRVYPVACMLVAPIFGGGVALLAVIAARHGVNLISTVVVVTIFIYFMLGMLFHAALLAALLVLVAYLVAATAAGLPAAQMMIDTSVLISTNIIGAIVCYSLEQTRRTSFLEEQLLIEAARRDGLTGIYNRRVFDDHIDRLWPQAIRDRVPLALILVDIDHFKPYNDHYGHQAGDECLRQVARSLSRSSRRPLDVTARYGGEEFAIVLYDARRRHVEEAAQRIHAGIEALAIEHGASSVGKRLTVSIGAACIDPQMGRSHFGFIQLADEALYAAKEGGRNRTVVMDKEYAQLSTGAFRKSVAGRRIPAL
ncbi:MAG TPA: GGDEF domain-containing protein [Steroidobacteraceae bacterium]|jgi:diguanylate cyclase (GGDEF)-like protein